MVLKGKIRQRGHFGRCSKKHIMLLSGCGKGIGDQQPDYCGNLLSIVKEKSGFVSHLLYFLERQITNMY